MTRFAAIALFALLAATAPAFAFSEDTRFTSTDGSARLTDPDDARPAFTGARSGNDSGNSGIHIETRNYNDPASPGFNDDSRGNRDDAFTRGYNRFGNQRD